MRSSEHVAEIDHVIYFSRKWFTHSSWHVCVDVASRTIRLNTSLFWASLPASVGLICSHFFMWLETIKVTLPFTLIRLCSVESNSQGYELKKCSHQSLPRPDLLTYCRVTSQFLVCDTSAAFSICDANTLQCFLSCSASSVISARSLLECSQIRDTTMEHYDGT